MATKSIVLHQPFTVSKNIPQPQPGSPEINCPEISIYSAILESLVKKHKIEKAVGHEIQFVSEVKTRQELDVKFYPDLFIAMDRKVYHAFFRFLADNNSQR